jgi:translation elongation factor EF-Tu-like GTPase
MSLISLTFGKGKEAMSCSEIEVDAPVQRIKVDKSIENKLEVLKACTFFQSSFVYIVGQIVSGVVKEQMVGSCNGKQFCIDEVESKIGNAAKQGMNVGLCVTGIRLDDVKKGDIISLSAAE